MGRIQAWLSERVPVSGAQIAELTNEPVPNHLKKWWFCLGGTPAYLFVVQIVTGILLALYYQPAPGAAYESIRYITQEATFGWFLRSMHKWAATLMIAAVILHQMRVYFTAAYRRPRELNWMIGMGLLSLIFAAFMLYRRRDIKRLFAYSSIEHMGIIVFAFGMAGPLGNFAGLLQMTMHSLTKSAIFFAVGHVAQVKGTQRLAEMGGLTTTHPVLGWSLVAGVAAIAGLPPFGVFTSEFLIASSTFARQPVLALLFVFGVLLAFGALLMRLTEVAFGPVRGPVAPVKASTIPMFAHLALVLTAGIWLPPPLVAWFRHVAAQLG